MSFVKNFKTFLNEARGVPDNLLNLASEIYSKIINLDFSQFRFETEGSEDLLTTEVDLDGPFHISDFLIQGINI